MAIIQSFKMAAKSILANKLRSFLTMLGIIIGVSSVIALVALGQGTTKAVVEQVQGLGSDIITVQIFGRGWNESIDYEESLQLAEVNGIQAIAPVNSQNATVKYGTTSTEVSIIGTNMNYITVQDYDIATGRFLAPLDLDFRQQVAVLGADTANELFGATNAVGEYVYINGIRYKVVGILQAKGDTSTGSSDEMVIVPLTSIERQFQSLGVRTIYAQVESEEMMDLAKLGIQSQLTELFRGDTDSFHLFNQEDLLETVTSISDTLTLALGGISSISLLVGGIGIMNIMLVSVTERTREIGIRKAIGAKRKNILTQFLIEAVLLSGLGGIIGVGLGIGAANVISQTMHMDVIFSMDIILLAFSFSLLVGIIFGLFPANKAAKLKPIDALRYE